MLGRRRQASFELATIASQLMVFSLRDNSAGIASPNDPYNNVMMKEFEWTVSGLQQLNF